ncbi:MAG: N-acetylmuramoyl-L-alanine amidase [Chlorobi bacterium]|nr:N-acetylmuramoyl-L-alanine amidase [Chlorobiota bacterium]
MKIRTVKILLLFTLTLLFSSCASTRIERVLVNDSDIRLYEKPKDWENPETREKTIKKYSRYLAGKKIFIDPGHGGKDKRNKSRSGKVIEAEVNLRVALYLKKYLEAAGAVVYMSREKDETVGLKERPLAANQFGADIFISVHHNSPGSVENDWTDYTSTYYHSREGEEGFVPAAKDLARFVQRDLAYAVRNSGGLGSFDGTYSDYKIYPDKGFAVLRLAEMPAILVECAFHTNHNEEIRLQINEFNKIEAWGIFRGLGRYFLNGVPEIKLLKEESVLSGGKLSLVFELSDKNGIDKETISAKFDGVKMDFNFDEKTNRLSFGLSEVASGEHFVEIKCKNRNGNDSFPFRKKIIVK